MTVGTHPSGKVDLVRDLRLIKAAILYSDRAELYSLTTALLLAWETIEQYTLSERLQFLTKVIPFISSSREGREIIKFLRQHKRELSKPPFKQTFEKSWNAILEAGNDIAEQARLSEIHRAIDSGRIDVHRFYGLTNRKMSMEHLADFLALVSDKPSAKLRGPQIERRQDAVINEFVEGVLGAVTDGQTHPLFDAGVGALVDAAAREGKIDVSQAASIRGKHTALAGHLLTKLPLFDAASVDEVLDIRSDLDKPLVKFRQSMLRYSDMVRTAAWERGFSEEAEIIFHREVAPAVQEIEDAVKGNAFLASLARGAVDRPLVAPAGGALSLVLSQFANLPEAVALGLGLGTSAAALVYDTCKEWEKQRRQVEGNGLYFYYETGRRLG